MFRNCILKILLSTSVLMFVFVADIFVTIPFSGTGNNTMDTFSAAASETKVTKTELNMRTGPGTSYPIILVIPKGASVTVTGYSGVWAKILYGGKSGYCHSYYLADNTATAETRYTTADLNMRTGPGTGYSIILVIPKGASVNIISYVNGWAKVLYNGKIGYASTAYLSSSPSVTPVSYTASVYTTIANLNLRSGPSTSYSVLLVIPQETPVVPLGISSGWYKVTYGGKTGYVSGSYISVSDSRKTVEDFVNSKGLSSSTGYLVWVNTKTIHTYVFTGKTGSWTLQKDMLCTVGKESTPTIKGTFSILSKGSYFHVEDHDDWICKNYSQFYGDYLMHSVIYNTSGQLVDGRLGMRLSKGCVRLSLENARYIYYNVPIGSRVYVN